MSRLRGEFIWRTFLDAVFPRTCPICDGVLEADADLWCAECAGELSQTIAGPCCPTCGATTGPYTTPDQRCLHCRNRKMNCTRVVRVGPYRDVWRDVILRYKHGGRQHADRALARMLADTLVGRGCAGAADVLVPIPTHARAAFGRRHDPVAQVSAQLGRLMNRPSLRLLRKRWGGRPQVGLSPSQRWENIRGNFRLRLGARPGGATICLVDDISTTGATLDEAARVLRKAGARDVFAVVLAKTDSPLA